MTSSFKQQKLLGMIYQNELAVEVQRLGYGIAPRANGQFELRGYQAEDLQTFSKRREADSGGGWRGMRRPRSES